MLSIIWAVIKIILLFGVTIFVHELGHFLVARWCGMIVDTFSIGFGPAIWKRKRGDTTYKIGCIPFGGYVALPQMEPDLKNAEKDDEDEEKRILPPTQPWKKILVSLAGATGNIILAFIVAYIVYWGGTSYAPVEEECVIGYVDTNSTMYAEGIRMGDIINSVNDKPINNWQEFVIDSALSDSITLDITKADSGKTITMPVEITEIMGQRVVEGIYPGNYCYVLKVEPESSADKAGILPGDRVLELNNQELYSREHLVELVADYRDQTIPAKVLRKGETVELQVTPQYNEQHGRVLIGIMFNTFDVKPPLEQIKSHAMVIFRLLKALVTPKEAKHAASSIGGPVRILEVFWFAVRVDWVMALWFTGLLNVNLAIINLLPIPVLDGGHIVFALWEWVTRRPISARVFNTLINIFATLLIGVFLLLTFNDVKSIVMRFKAQPAAEETVVTETNAVMNEADNVGK